MIGSDGPWLSDAVLGDGPAQLSFRTGRWSDLGTWRTAARKRTLECLAPVSLGTPSDVRVESRHEFDGLHVERLSWQLASGPRTEAVLLRPADAVGRLPGILALHDHSGNKFLGWRKIARTDEAPWTIQRRHQDEGYEGLAWANEVARRGYVVLAHDTFPFASRRVRVADVSPDVRGVGVDPEPEDLEGVGKYNAFAADHEHIMEKSLLCAGTTWPGVYLVEDQRALDILCARPEVDASRIGCAGLSGGGMRTVFLGGLDDRIRCAIAVCFMTTWRDFLLDKCFTHTWMMYVPLCRETWTFRRSWHCARRRPRWFSTAPRIICTHCRKCAAPTRCSATRSIEPAPPASTGACSIQVDTSSTAPCRRTPSVGSIDILGRARRTPEIMSLRCTWQPADPRKSAFQKLIP